MWSDLVWRLRALVSRGRIEAELDDELRFHFDRQVERYRAAGLGQAEAERRTRLEFGGFDQVKEEYRDALGVRLVDEVRRDVRQACRALGATPVPSATALLTLALVIGVNTAVFVIANGLLLRPLPVPEPERLVHVTDSLLREDGTTRIRAWSYPAWQQIRQQVALFAGATAWSFSRFDLASGGEARFVEGLWADGNFFAVLGVPASIGRTFSIADDRPNGGPDGPVTVISHDHWRHRYDAAADIVGRVVHLNGVAFTIIGVTPEGFSGVEVGRAFDFIVPLQSSQSMARGGGESRLQSASTQFLTILARLKPGQSVAAASAALREAQPDIRHAIFQVDPAVVARDLTAPFTVVVASGGYSTLRSNYERPVKILVAIVTLVLLIGSVNIANLSLARALSRHHEISVRLALGGSRTRVTRQLVVESLVLTAAGASLGLLIAAFGAPLFVNQLATSARPVFLDVSVDRVVVGFVVAVMALTAVLFSVAPVLWAARIAPVDALKARGRAAEARGGFMPWLVVAQVALSVVLVVAAGLFVRSFVALTTRDLGLDPTRVLVATVDTQGTTAGRRELPALYEDIRAAASRLPDVADAAISLVTPVGGGGFTPPLDVVTTSGTQQTVQAVAANEDVVGNLISVGWFRALGMRLIAGRDIAETDRRGAPIVVVVNDAFTRRFFGDQSPLGQRVIVYPGTPRAMSAEIVGVTNDSIYGSPRDAAPPTWYLPIGQFGTAEFPFTVVRLIMRARSGSVELLNRSVTDAVTGIDARLVMTFEPLAAQIQAALTRERLMAQLAGGLGALALVLAGLGLYGLSAHAVSHRRNEIAVRIALGAVPRRVTGVVLGRISLLVGLGIAGGIALSLWASRFVAGLVYGLAPTEPSTFVGAGVLLSVASIVAVWLPARHIARMNPVDVLRQD